MSFKDFIKKSNSVSSKLKEALKEEKSRGYSKDDRYWKPEVDKSGVGGAVIRFLPPPDGEEFAFVKYFHHSFKVGTQWYIENSRTTLNEPDPVTDYNREHWDDYSDFDKMNRKRKASYVSNIYVIKDPFNPENNGKHFLFKYGVKIFEKLMAEFDPEEDVLGLDIDKKEPYEPWQYAVGANFIIKIKQTDNKGGKGKYWNYDDSCFDKQSMLEILGSKNEEDNIEKLEELHNSLYSLTDIIAPDKFKSYEKLQQRLMTVLGKGEARPTQQSDELEESNTSDGVLDELVNEYKASKKETPSFVKTDDEDEDEFDAELSEFAKLAED
jgi:hypothetical protein